MLNKLVSLLSFKERAYNKKVEEHEVWARNTINRFRELSKQYGTEGKKKEIGLDLGTSCYGISTSDNSFSDLVELTNLNNYLTSKPHESFKDVVRCSIFDTYKNPRQYYKSNLPDDVSVLHSVYIYLNSVKEFLTKLSNLTYFEN